MTEQFRYSVQIGPQCQHHCGERVAGGVGNYQQSNTKQNGELITQAVSNEQIFNIWNNPQKRILGKY